MKPVFADTFFLFAILNQRLTFERAVVNTYMKTSLAVFGCLPLLAGTLVLACGSGPKPAHYGTRTPAPKPPAENTPTATSTNAGPAKVTHNAG